MKFANGATLALCIFAYSGVSAAPVPESESNAETAITTSQPPLEQEPAPTSIFKRAAAAEAAAMGAIPKKPSANVNKPLPALPKKKGGIVEQPVPLEESDWTPEPGTFDKKPNVFKKVFGSKNK